MPRSPPSRQLAGDPEGSHPNSAIGLIERYPNLLVVHTLSKARSLAGLRVGFAVGQRHLIEALERVKDSFNSYPLGRPAQAGAIASLEDEAYFQQSRTHVIEGRERLNRGLVRLGFEVLPSSANFVFARHRAHEGAALAAALRLSPPILYDFKNWNAIVTGTVAPRTKFGTVVATVARIFVPNCSAAMVTKMVQ